MAAPITGVAPYNKIRDHAFILKLIEQYLHEWPEAPAFADLDSPIVYAHWTDKDGSVIDVHHRQQLFVYLQDNTVIGFIRLFEVPQNDAGWEDLRILVQPIIATNQIGMIEQLGVAPAYKKTGIASALIQHACKNLKQQGMQAIIFSVMSDNADMLPLLQKQGLSKLMTVTNEESTWGGAYDWYVFETKNIA